MVMLKSQCSIFTTLSPLLLIVLIYSTTTTTTSAQTPAPEPSSAPTDIIRILKKAGGFTTLIRLLTTTQVSTQINSQLLNNNGLTLLAPNDNAFQSLKPGFLNSLNDQQKNELIQFHVLPTFVSVSSFDTLSNPVRTQAGDDPERLALNITSSGGNQVNMTTGVVNATLGGSVYSDHQLAVYQVDKVLLPKDFFLPKPSPPPAPAPEKAKASKKKSSDSPASTDASSAFSLKQRNSRMMWVSSVVVGAVASAAVLSLK